MKMQNSETLLLEVEIDGEEYHLTLMDGSKWFVNPGDLPTVATWLPTTNISIEDMNDGSMFFYKLTNLNDDISIRAMKYIE
jgi:hypothetical protein